MTNANGGGTLRITAGGDGIKAAIKAGIDTIEHASLVDDEGIKLAASRARTAALAEDGESIVYGQTAFFIGSDDVGWLADGGALEEEALPSR